MPPPPLPKKGGDIPNDSYYTGKNEILAWIRSKYQPGFQRIEDLGSGAVYCQIFESMYPGTITISKVKFEAVSEAEILHNFKTLQAALEKHGHTRCAFAAVR